MTGLVAVQAIDIAIFGSLGGLWVLGALFIVALYRWILRFERSSRSTPMAPPAVARKAPASASPRVPVETVAVAS